jgi:hypothetical protein
MGVKTFDHDGKEHVDNLSATNLMTMIGQLSPEKLIEYDVGRGDKERQFKIEERKVGAEETKAGAAGLMHAPTKKFVRATRASTTKFVHAITSTATTARPKTSKLRARKINSHGQTNRRPTTTHRRLSMNRLATLHSWQARSTHLTPA